MDEPHFSVEPGTNQTLFQMLLSVDFRSAVLTAMVLFLYIRHRTFAYTRTFNPVTNLNGCCKSPFS